MDEVAGSSPAPPTTTSGSGFRDFARAIEGDKEGATPSTTVAAIAESWLLSQQARRCSPHTIAKRHDYHYDPKLRTVAAPTPAPGPSGLPALRIRTRILEPTTFLSCRDMDSL
jgi:hypothetical protein